MYQFISLVAMALKLFVWLVFTKHVYNTETEKKKVLRKYVLLREIIVKPNLKAI